MKDLDKLKGEADEASRRFIVNSGEPQMIREMALWLTFEFEAREGEGQRAAEHRLELEARRRWPGTTSDDIVRAQELCGRAMEVSNAILERDVDGHKLH
jgi:hypothetical protein